MIVTAIIMILYTSGGVLEHTYHEGISSCLKQKREIGRLGWKDTENTRYACERRKVEIVPETNEVLRLLDG